MSMYTIDDIRKLGPCYDPSRYLPEDWQGDAITILEHPDIPELDKIWVVRNWLPERTLRLFAVWCARQALSLVADPDPRSVAACDVAEKFATGVATKADLQTAREAAATNAATIDAYATNAANAYAAIAAANAANAAAANTAYAAAANAAAAAGAYGDNRDDFLPQAIGELHHLAKKELNR